MWGLCGILTLTNVFEEGHPSRTDVRLKVLTNAKWFYVPYPGQFGVPSVTLSGVLGMLAGVLACTVESLSYYPTVSQMSGEYIENPTNLIVPFINLYMKYSIITMYIQEPNHHPYMQLIVA